MGFDAPAGPHPNKIGGLEVIIVKAREPIGIEADTGRDSVGIWHLFGVSYRALSAPVVRGR